MAESSGIFAGDERKQKEQQMREQHRLPPGQSLTLKWPVLHYGSVPHFDSNKWDFQLGGRTLNNVRLTWQDFNRLPSIELTRDFHCVTRWSRFDNRWGGVPFREILNLVQLEPRVSHVLVHAEQGYTANIPLADLDRDDVMLATRHNGQPLSADHGYPVRLIVPICMRGNQSNGCAAWSSSTTTSRDFGNRTDTTCMATRGKSSASKMMSDGGRCRT
ncbi:MAG: hypothetical protein NVS9B15_02510 [Acidobacteriaceae bacterium]